MLASFSRSKTARANANAGANEFAANTCQLKDLQTGQSEEISLADGTDALVTRIRSILAAAGQE